MIEILPLVLHSFGLSIPPPLGSSFGSDFPAGARERIVGKHSAQGQWR